MGLVTLFVFQPPIYPGTPSIRAFSALSGASRARRGGDGVHQEADAAGSASCVEAKPNTGRIPFLRWERRMNPRIDGSGRTQVHLPPGRRCQTRVTPPRLIHLLSRSACQLLLRLQLLSQWPSPGGRFHSEAAPRGEVDHLGLFISVLKS